MALPLSKDSTDAKMSRFFSTRSARAVKYLPRCWGVSLCHSPSNAFRAAATAMSTSFSEASATEQITFSLEGLMTYCRCQSRVFSASGNNVYLKSSAINGFNPFIVDESTQMELVLQRVHRIGMKLTSRLAGCTSQWREFRVELKEAWYECVMFREALQEPSGGGMVVL